MVSSVSWVRGKCVGKGAFGVVNVAISKRDNRVFAVKSVDCGRGLSGQVEALENEIGILKRVTSPHVVAYIGDDDRGVDTLSRIGYSDELPEFPIQLSELGKDFLEKCLRREPSERWSCDQLLQHPYLLPYYALVESSPRCVLDRVDSELNSESDYNDRDHQEEVFSIFTNIEENSVIKNRISKLATESRVNWETHGWVVVREVESNGEPTTTGTEEEGACTCERDGVGSNKEGVNWEFHNVAETGMVYSDSVGANRGIRKFGGSNTAGGGVGCCCRYGCGWEKLEGRVNNIPALRWVGTLGMGQLIGWIVQ
ncbi:hypothetical protein glysoja_009465 [Glycine soja]|nr:hypothetical protein glysoja_009465 [Glycine soja]